MQSSLEVAQHRRDAMYGRVLTYSPKVFLPVTNLCRNHCSYCTFRRSPHQEGAHTMPPDEVMNTLRVAHRSGCIEALLCLGDTPETGFPSYQRQLRSWGFSSTVDYLDWIARQAQEMGLLAHTNAGLLSASSMERLRQSNVSLGLMLESNSDRLCEKGMPHAKAPDKRPALRRQMILQAGELKIPFTSGILVGFGETEQERLEALDTLAELHALHGHVQEVIIQPFRPHSGTLMRDALGASDRMLIETISIARLKLPVEVSIQSPPNLAPGMIEALIDAGINDFGGISPVTPDFINPNYEWPHVARLAQRCRRHGFELKPRLPVYDRFVEQSGWIDAGLMDALRSVELQRVPAA
jgi:FO synthase